MYVRTRVNTCNSTCMCMHTERHTCAHTDTYMRTHLWLASQHAAPLSKPCTVLVPSCFPSHLGATLDRAHCALCLCLSLSQSRGSRDQLSAVCVPCSLPCLFLHSISSCLCPQHTRDPGIFGMLPLTQTHSRCQGSALPRWVCLGRGSMTSHPQAVSAPLSGL